MPASALSGSTDTLQVIPPASNDRAFFGSIWLVSVSLVVSEQAFSMEDGSPAALSGVPVRCLPLRVRFKYLPEGLSDSDDHDAVPHSGAECMCDNNKHVAELAHLSSWQAGGHGLRACGVLAPLNNTNSLEYRSECARRLAMHQSWLDLDVPLDMSLVRVGDFQAALLQHREPCLQQVPTLTCALSITPTHPPPLTIRSTGARCACWLLCVMCAVVTLRGA